ncbi:MAG: hypothetical protein HQL55_16955 [Magnetococcales bacterium]|nr:hypothetical protein [Magnetococcales bacterium]
MKKEVPAKVEGESKAAHRQQEAAVASALHAWAAAWSSQDVTRYLGYYSMQFKPADGTSRKDWEKVRTQRLRAPRFIQVQLSDVKVDMQDGGTAKVSFKQVYKSSSISSTGKKNLLMKQEAGAWRILQELFDG